MKLTNSIHSLRSDARHAVRRVGAVGCAESAFTMIEVALSLAIVGFAMVAIIGVLPTGLNVQQKNREDTIIMQDSGLLIEAIRSGLNSGALSVLAENMVTLQVSNSQGTATFVNGDLTPREIVAQLCRPASEPNGNTNQVFAQFRSLSGNLGERALTNSTVVFSYLVQPEIRPYTNFLADTNSPYYTNFMGVITNNLHEVKLTFQWPVYESGAIGQNRQVVRTLISGRLLSVGLSAGFLTNGYFFQANQWTSQ